MRGLIVGLTVAIAGLVAAGCSASSKTTGSQSAASVTGVVTTTVPLTTVMTLSGSDTQTSPAFTVSGGWYLKYSFDCSNFAAQGNFIVTVLGSDGTPNYSDPGPDLLSASGGSTTYEPHGGTLTLDVASECSWTVAALGTT